MPGQVQYYIKMWVEMLKRKKTKWEIKGKKNNGA